MQLSGKPAEENASDENKDDITSLVKDKDEQNSKNTPSDAEAPPDAPTKLEEDITVKTPDEIVKDGRKLCYTSDVITQLNSDTNEASKGKSVPCRRLQYTPRW